MDRGLFYRPEQSVNAAVHSRRRRRRREEEYIRGMRHLRHKHEFWCVLSLTETADQRQFFTM
jgi:hypothetical protein